jgi:hypothetical protein
VSDTSQGPGWWQASDGKWYPPEQAPGYQPAPGPGGAPQPAGGAPGSFDVGAAVSWAWAKYSANLQPLLILGLVVAGVPFILAVISGFVGGFIGLGVYFVSLIAGLVLAMLAVQAGLELATTGQLNQAEMWKLKGNVGAYVVGAILFGILEVVGICALCVGFFFVWLIFGLWAFACIAEGAGGLQSLTRSKDITLGLGLGNIFVPMIIYMAVGGGFFILGFGSRFGSVIGVFLVPFSAIYGAYVYRSFTNQAIAA